MKKLLVHISVWLILTYFLYIPFALFLPWEMAIARAVAGISLIAGMFYISGWVLASHFLVRRKKYVLFFLSSILLCIVFSIIRVKLLGLFPESVPAFTGRVPREFFESKRNLNPGYNPELLNRLKPGRAAWLPGFIMNVVILFVATLFRLYEHKAEKEQESREELQRSQEAQILYLKSQVNPHFLFNTLNNLYGLTYSKSELAPQMVLGLSDTMRYLIYETEQKLVPVEKELDFIRNYLDLEKKRISHPENIRLSVNMTRQTGFIPPLLLLPFVENCFKHGTIGREDEGWIELDIWDEKERFFFVCKNSYREDKKAGQTKGAGLGLVNVRKRLDLIFGENYELKIVKQEDEYMVSLRFPVFSKKEEL
ncbi:MAG: two-component system, LytTR family, sensor kinase [Anaerophaga sp.]|nr:two-component system, LytTR family, sensor kinase [Anaerophaga sp.]